MSGIWQRAEDDFTSTVDAAAAFERIHGDDGDSLDGPEPGEPPDLDYDDYAPGDQVVFSDGIPSGEPPDA